MGTFPVNINNTINKRKMNIEHPTSNVERRRMKSLCSVLFYRKDMPEAYHSLALGIRY